ncbi:MAG: hypothetical protein FWG07_00965, partial [Treponema sp.]|nr:hypothetical protein [Treponema sp.]
FVGRQMAFMVNLSPTCVATFSFPMRSVRNVGFFYNDVFIHHKNLNLPLCLAYRVMQYVLERGGQKVG